MTPLQYIDPIDVDVQQIENIWTLQNENFKNIGERLWNSKKKKKKSNEGLRNYIKFEEIL